MQNTDLRGLIELTIKKQMLCIQLVICDALLSFLIHEESIFSITQETYFKGNITKKLRTSHLYHFEAFMIKKILS